MFFAETVTYYEASSSISSNNIRILRGEGIFQATMMTVERVIPKSVIIQDGYICDLSSHSLPYTTPRTVGLRKMTPSDVPKALALTNQYIISLVPML